MSLGAMMRDVGCVLPRITGIREDPVMKNLKSSSSSVCTRRDVFRTGTFVAATSFLGSTAHAAARLPTRGKGPNVYERIGVKPFINCTSTRTMNGGSAALPEVAEAVYEASFYHVNMQELLRKAGPHIAELLQVPAAMISTGAAGALTCATLACMAGGDIETLQQLPNTEGIKDEVVAFRRSRSIYDHAIRMTGAKMVNVDTPEDLERAFGPQTFMAFAGQQLQGPDSKIPLETFVKAAHAHGVPVLIDAAAELPLMPDPFLSKGVDLVAYSGGKSLKGPQTTGLLLSNRKDLAQAAFVGSAPHHTYARPLKVSKEEVMGLIAAVEALVTTRNVADEYGEFKQWFKHVIGRITTVPGVTARIVESPRPGYYPTMYVEWDTEKIGLVAREVGEQMLHGEPRIMTHAFPKELDPTSSETNHFAIRPMAMYSDDHKVVAERLYEVFRSAPGPKPEKKPAPPSGSLDGHWEVDIMFVANKSRHKLYLQTKGNDIRGLHVGRIADGKVKGEIDGDQVYFESRGKYEAARMRYFFKGRLRGDEMGGELGLGEYGKATWKARRVG
jgi:L-seryl-tRNA(Ser) seleniumtransferase